MPNKRALESFAAGVSARMSIGDPKVHGHGAKRNNPVSNFLLAPGSPCNNGRMSREQQERSYELIERDGRAPVKAWTRGVVFEDGARQQVDNLASLPFIHGWIAVMPDVHFGIGATVGSVIATDHAIIPAAVGVDLGCGMQAVRTTLVASDLPESLGWMRMAIEAAVPHGQRGGAWQEPPEHETEQWKIMAPGFKVIMDKHPRIKNGPTVHQLGTLGGGNHFIEICLDEEQRVWIMLHSGSRGVGNRIGSYFIELAKQDMRRWFINLPDEALAYFPEGTDHFDDYVHAVGWAQDYAKVNRELMMRSVIATLRKDPKLPEFDATSLVVSCHHNYVERENHLGKNVLVTRKGAVRARVGDLGIIPGSMGARSYIVRGKGNVESFQSCSHGAGRVMSRGKATRTFSLEDHERATAGVECRKDKDVLDETPGAYKDIDQVMAAQSDLVEIVHTLKQVLCVKG